ncbi:MAG: asparagine synthase (glutamine-hydrolyzing) [bacterium]
MCGIAGIIAGKDINEKAIKSMVGEITHRGPDDDGFLIENLFAFGMRRLSIIDLSRGHQPISNEDGTITIVFNGEIYNYKELSIDLKGKGHIFKTESDTETLVHLYEEYGKKMVDKLRGMFGFSIFDRKKNTLFIARDQFGIKPLYYRVDSVGKIASYASEIKALLKDDRYKIELNRKVLPLYLEFQYNPLEETLFKDIYTLLPGHTMTVDLNNKSFEIKKYWEYTFNKDSDADDYQKKIFDVMKDSVEHHMISDVPVGAFLSGGIDSAIIVTLMQQIRTANGLDPVQTFTIGFNEVSEHSEAREVSDILGTNHTEIKINFDEYLKNLPKIAWHFDQPVADPSAVALYFLAREASKKVKVVLSGEGSDELFGGYNIYREPFALKAISWVPKFLIRLCTKLPFNFFGKNYLRRVLLPIEERYIGNARVFSENEVLSILKEGSGEVKSAPLLSSFYGKLTGLSDSKKMQMVDINYWLPGDILAKADKMTMAHSLEARVPFLDMEVYRVSSTIPDSLKYYAGTTKYALRQAFKNILPQTTAGRKKLGFPTPIKHWLKANPSAIRRYVLNNELIKSDFNVSVVTKLFDDHASGAVDTSRRIFVLLMLSLWYDIYIKAKDQDQLAQLLTDKLNEA